MTLLLQPNVEHADRLVLRALQRRYGEGADFATRGEAPGFPLAELVEDDGGSYSAYTGAQHFGKVARQLMRLVYELNVHSAHGTRPQDVSPKSVWVVDVMHAVTPDTRTAYLAVTAGGAPVLMPLPDLPGSLLDGSCSANETRASLRVFAVRMADLVNLALPAARTLAVEDSMPAAG
ncbi:hypothetical protein OJ998_09950 [Solirubrobacter taibaiensis]|nr:hypothetical protein [Solirubrobacter taibaiensis]